jgi:hypothetical protein
VGRLLADEIYAGNPHLLHLFFWKPDLEIGVLRDLASEVNG